MQIVLENNILHFDILIHFDIIIETAPNLNKTKNLFFCFFAEWILEPFWISNQPNSRCVPYIFLKRFLHWNLFETNFFFKWMGVRALSGSRKRGRACPPFHRKKTFLKHFSIKKSFLQKVKEFYLKWGWFEIRNVLNSAKKQKSLILFKLEAVSNVI